MGGNPMTRIEVLKGEIERLSPEELAEFRDWFLQYDWQAWDRQIEAGRRFQQAPERPWRIARRSQGRKVQGSLTRRSKTESERMERLARMTALAEEVWEDPDLAHEFLTSPQPQLGGRRPVELADSDLETRRVEEILFRLEYSLPA